VDQKKSPQKLGKKNFSMATIFLLYMMQQYCRKKFRIFSKFINLRPFRS